VFDTASSRASKNRMVIHSASASETPMLALAQSAGAQAFAWAGASVGLMLCCAALLSAHAMLRATTPGTGKAIAPPGRGARESAIAYAPVVIAIAVFAVIAWQSGAGGLAEVDHAFSETAHANAPQWLLQASSWLTQLGDGLVLGLVCVVVAAGLFASREPVLAIGLAVAMGGNGVLNALLKHAFARQRPPHLQDMPQFHGSGFPSSHASASLVAYGMLAYLLLCLLPRRWHMAVVCWAAAIVLAVSSSRILLGAHYTSDVIAGLASGTAWLSLCILAMRPLRRRPSAGTAWSAHEPPTPRTHSY
jgi:undecaprenyl-diphosphatase